MSVVVRKRMPEQDAFQWTGDAAGELQLLGCLADMKVEASVDLRSRELTLTRVATTAIIYRVGDWILFDPNSGWPMYCSKEAFDTCYEVVRQ